jgi:hypothetical protein
MFIGPHIQIEGAGNRHGNLQTTMMFDSAVRAGRLKAWSAVLKGESRRPLQLDKALAGKHISNRYSAGVQSVQIARIKGSTTKSDFDIDFYPTKAHIEERWGRVAQAVLHDVYLPPVELIELDGVYYVVDGHHRVSVSRAFGHTYIDAVVTRLETT